jgi:hypothetical protein
MHIIGCLIDQRDLYRPLIFVLIFLCKTCKKTFSENRATPFFGLHTPKETVLRSMAMGANKDSAAL